MLTYTLFLLAENHVGLIQQLGQPVPQNVMMLLQDSRKRAEKREAKRLANRKSASTSRARKKALVKEMTEMNVRLRRQALILSLLPDLVVAVTEQGKVTFCGPQVDRVLQFTPDDLMQSKGFFQFLVPESQRKLQRLIHQHFHPNQKLPAAAMAQQFPLSVVNLDSVNSDENDTSDTSAASNGKQPSSLTDSKAANSDDSEEPQQQPRKKRRRYQDDVTGATVTANNADARLSSLAHTSTTSSEDNDTSSGGYRAQEDTSSSDDAAESEPGMYRIMTPQPVCCSLTHSTLQMVVVVSPFLLHAPSASFAAIARQFGAKSLRRCTRPLCPPMDPTPRLLNQLLRSKPPPTKSRRLPQNQKSSCACDLSVKAKKPFWYPIAPTTATKTRWWNR